MGFGFGKAEWRINEEKDTIVFVRTIKSMWVKTKDSIEIHEILDIVGFSGTPVEIQVLFEDCKLDEG